MSGWFETEPEEWTVYENPEAYGMEARDLYDEGEMHEGEVVPFHLTHVDEWAEETDPSEYGLEEDE